MHSILPRCAIAAARACAFVVTFSIAFAATLILAIAVTAAMGAWVSDGPDEVPRITPGSPTPRMFTVSGLTPGSVAVTSISCRNEAPFAGRGTLTEAPDPVDRAEARLARHLTMEVVDEGSGEPVYAGPLNRASAVDLGRFGAGQLRTYRLEVALDRSAPDSTQGVELRMRFIWRVA